jgi:hypothetical protein
LLGFPALASTSMEQARVAMCHAFDLSVFNHPTLAEAYKYAAYDGLGNLARARSKTKT